MLNWTGFRTEQAKTLFGCPARVATAAWILARRGEPFFQQEAQDAVHGAVGVSATAVRNALVVFVEQGLLSKVSVGHRVYFTSSEHPLWEAWAVIAGGVGIRSEPAPSAMRPGVD
ncbi:MAG TPA: hypothetical protein VHB02_05790 [Acidimicrobiales bacterium]|nr:hypothetical protein [Acidimicrobiales bacterium]